MNLRERRAERTDCLVLYARRITSDEYDKRVAVCKQQEATFLEELKGHSEADEAFVLSCSYILEVAKRASELFMRSQPDQKNRLLRFVFANASVEGEKLNYKLKSVFEGIVQCNKTKNWLRSLYQARAEIKETCQRLEAAFSLLHRAAV